MDNTNYISNKLTIVIPSKNEGMGLYRCLNLIASQNDVDGVRVIIADSSTDTDSIKCIYDAMNHLDNKIQVERVPGGFPSEARFNGGRNVKTEYLLFLDADTMLMDTNILKRCLTELESDEKIDLLTTTIETDPEYDWVYKIFYGVQLFSKKVLKTSFAVGGFQLWRTDSYVRVGEYNPSELFAEDYSLSKRVPPERFSILKLAGVYTSSRRFKKKGVLWMFYIMLMSYFNRNNPDFFHKSHGYWD